MKKNIVFLDSSTFPSNILFPKLSFSHTWKNYKFTKKAENPDFSLRRVGVYAGKIDSDIDKSEQSHYFIKLDPQKNKEHFLERYGSIVFETDNTVGPRSISKQEFIAKLNICF